MGRATIGMTTLVRFQSRDLCSNCSEDRVKIWEVCNDQISLNSNDMWCAVELFFAGRQGHLCPTYTHKGFYLWNFSDFVILLHAILRLRMHSVPLNSEGMNSFAQKFATAGLSVWWRLGAQTIQQVSRLNVEHAFSLMVLSSEVRVNNCSPRSEYTTFNGWDLLRAEILPTRERNDTPQGRQL
jgi:hypothetical protein